jgi:hypothetical protein
MNGTGPSHRIVHYPHFERASERGEILAFALAYLSRFKRPDIGASKAFLNQETQGERATWRGVVRIIFVGSRFQEKGVLRASKDDAGDCS